MKKNSLYFRLGYNFSIITIIPLIFMAIGSFFMINFSLNHMIIVKNVDIVRSLSRELTYFHKETESKIIEIQQIIDGNLIDETSFSGYLNLIVENNFMIDAIQKVDQNFIITTMAPYNKSQIDIDLSGHPFIKEAQKKTEIYWSRTFLSPDNGNPTITMTSLKADYGLIFYINLDFLGKLIVSDNEEQGHTFILDRDGTFLAHPDKQAISRRENLRNIPYIKELIDSGEINEYSHLSKDEIMTLKVISPTGWIIGFKQSKNQAFSMINYYRLGGVIVALLTLAVALVLAFFTLRDTVSPITDLIGITKAVSNGDYNAQIKESYIREVDDLSTQFRKMVISVKERENELCKLRNYLSNIINSMPSILVCIDSSYIVTVWNKKAAQITGISSSLAIGQSIFKVLGIIESMTDTIAKSISTGEIKIERKSLHQSESEILYDDIMIYPLEPSETGGAVIRIDDVTEMIRMEEIIIQSDKMLSVGGLAAGMAHEINNPLAGIIQTASVMENRLWRNMDNHASRQAADEAGISIESVKKFMISRGIPEMLKKINISGQRIAGIVNNMISFSNKGEGDLLNYSLNELVDRTIELAETDIDLKQHYHFEQIDIKREYTQNLPDIKCEEAKIQQVIFNVLKNGTQVMGDAGTDNPCFTIRTNFEEKEKMIILEIEDNGPGMNNDVRKRIFEPFFTTRPVGSGTGLGLSVSYFIIAEIYKGKMTALSTPGKGTIIIIKMPVDISLK